MRNYTCKATILPTDRTSDYHREITFYVDGKNKQEAESHVMEQLGRTLLHNNKNLYLKSLRTSLVKGNRNSWDVKCELGLQWQESTGWDDGFMDIRKRTFVVFSHVVDMDRRYAYLMNFLVTARISDDAFKQAEQYLYSRKLRYYEDTYNAVCTDRKEAVEDAESLPVFKKDAECFYSKEGPTQGKIDLR